MIGCIIQARMNSRRLPNKVMAKIDNVNPTLFYVINQLKFSKLIDKIVVATTTKIEDDEIYNFVKQQKIDCFRGSELDVLDRYYQCAKYHSFSTIIRIPADKPLIDPMIVDKMLHIFKTNSYDYVTNFLVRTFPSGSEVEIFNFKSLEESWKNAKLPSEREHVTPYLYNNKSKFKIFNLKNRNNQSHFRWAIDRDEDLKLVRILLSRITARPILTEDILHQFELDPTLIEINKNVDYYEGIQKSKKEDQQYIKLNSKE